MSRRKGCREGDEESDRKLRMTPMIDVVFLLLIFFLASFSPMDELSHLDVLRPRHDETVVRPPKDPIALEIMIAPEGFSLNGRRMNVAKLDAALTRFARVSRRQTVLVSCRANSSHDDLVTALDICAKTGLRNVNVVSLEF